jgi:hypothetical protein
MYVNQGEGMAFHELLVAVPVGVRSTIEGIAQRALREAGVECGVDEHPGGYARIIGREALRDFEGIVTAQEEMRAVYDAHFNTTEV